MNCVSMRHTKYFINKVKVKFCRSASLILTMSYEKSFENGRDLWMITFSVCVGRAYGSVS